MRFSKTLLVFALLLLSIGCQTLAKRNNTGVIVARRAQIRSSTAVVAADLLQVNRGDVVDILESTDVTDPSDNLRKERWLRVKARDTDFTEGWIESRNVMPDDVLADSKKLAAEDKDVPAQATGQLRASSNLRLTPDRSDNENIMMRLDSGSSFDIISWKRVPKPKRKTWVSSKRSFTTAFAISMLIKPKGLRQEMPTPAPTRGVATSKTATPGMFLGTSVSEPISTKARPTSPSSEGNGNG